MILDSNTDIDTLFYELKKRKALCRSVEAHYQSLDIYSYEDILNIIPEMLETLSKAEAKGRIYTVLRAIAHMSTPEINEILVDALMEVEGVRLDCWCCGEALKT